MVAGRRRNSTTAPDGLLWAVGVRRETMMRKLLVLAGHPAVWLDLARAAVLWPIMAAVEWAGRRR